MRIRGQGTSFAGQGGNGRDSGRAERFRKAHRAGQKVRGTVVEWHSQDLAWVEIDGHRLLARVSRHAALGLERRFLIESVSPEIVLRELTGASQGLDLVV